MRFGTRGGTKKIKNKQFDVSLFTEKQERELGTIL